MRLGMFMQPVHDPKRNLTQVLREDQEAIVLADQLGFEEVFVGEHVTASVEPVTAPLIFMATLIEKTRQIKFGTGVFCLPQYHPAMVAGQAAMFDHLSNGRFILGIGNGSLSSDVEMFDEPGADRSAMVRESIDHILALWDGEPPYNREGKYWHVKMEDTSRLQFGVSEMIKPLQQPHPPIAISIMSPGSSSALMAGERGWIPISGASFLQPRYTASHWEKYEEGCGNVGRTPDREDWRVSRSIIIAPSDEEARDYVFRPDGAIHFWYEYLLSSLRGKGVQKFIAPADHPSPDDVQWHEAAESMIAYGSPSTVLDKLVELRDTTGHFGVLTMLTHEWDDPAFCQRSMRMLVEDVMPAFRQHAKATKAA